MSSAAAASKSPKLLSSQFLPQQVSKPAPRSMRKGITTQLVYVPLSPRLQALASPGPCTPFSLEEVNSGNDYVSQARANVGNIDSSSSAAATSNSTPLQDKLDAAFTRHRAGVNERRTYSSVLATQR